MDRSEGDKRLEERGEIEVRKVLCVEGFLTSSEESLLCFSFRSFLQLCQK